MIQYIFLKSFAYMVLVTNVLVLGFSANRPFLAITIISVLWLVFIGFEKEIEALSPVESL